MQHLTLSDLAFGLEHLLTRADDALTRLHAATIYRPALQEHYDDIVALLSRTSTKGMPLANELQAADITHDTTGDGVRLNLQSYIRNATLADDLRAAAARLTSELIPTGADLKRTYIGQAKAARDHRAKLPDYADDLRRFPTADGRTLYDWFTDHLDAADLIYALLRQRIALLGQDKDTLALEASPKGSTLRNNTLALLSRFRKFTVEELAMRADLPPSLEGSLFGMLDLLQESHIAKPPTPPAPTSPPATDASTDASTSTRDPF